MSIIKDFDPNDLLGHYNFEKDYTNDDKSKWKTLNQNVEPVQNSFACESYLSGKDYIGLGDNLPDLETLNIDLLQKTGWQIVVVNGLLPVEDFYRLLSKKIFPSATLLRPWHSLSFIGEPDLFHDIMGHLPMFYDKEFSNFLQLSAEKCYTILNQLPNGSAIKEKAIQEFGRFGWFTWEAGLIKENGKTKAYGGAILSSSEETVYAISAEKIRFDIDQVINTAYTDKVVNPKYFVADSYQHLHFSLEQLVTKY